MQSCWDWRESAVKSVLPIPFIAIPGKWRSTEPQNQKMPLAGRMCNIRACLDRIHWAVAGVLSLAVYLPVAHLGIIVYDDGDYVTENPMVREGLTPAGIKWAFTTIHSANSASGHLDFAHGEDSQLFGLDPVGPHRVNALLHAANSVLVFVLSLQLFLADRQVAYSLGENVVIWPAAFIAPMRDLACFASSSRTSGMTSG